MDREKAKAYAEEMIQTHLPGQGWRFEWDNAKARFGACHYTLRVISLSAPLTDHVTEEEMRDTVAHEVAHAIAGYTAAHGPLWKATARRLGATPQAKSKSSTLRAQQAPWVGTCPAGHEVRRLWRRPRRVGSCRKCSPVWDPAHKVTYVNVDTLERVE